MTRERIVQAALGLARQEGLAGVSMRKLAQELGVEAMSLYHHVPNKRALLVLMADRSLATLRPVDPATPWTERLTGLLQDIFHAGMENPAMISVLVAQELDAPDVNVSGRSAIEVIDSILEILADSGLSAQDQVHAYNSLISLVCGFVLGPALALTPAPPNESVREQRRLSGAAVETLPALAGVLDRLHTADAAADLRFSLDLYVGALDRLAASK
ncbi:TetR/AcrR family transcriptional regulator [Nakamurella panacisegetis]|uniref:TetR/AcrR family transcriptional regulator n=1 Tax=Nakamurella panacisegetis TaxID=1090615 RepID=UPI0012FD5D5C|nr:TetR family transcriptional regulator [Nakamurella panacisegetis]